MNIESDNVSYHIGGDALYTREVIYQAVEKCMDILDGATDLAKECEHPRAFEVAAGVSSELVRNVEALVKLQERMEKMNSVVEDDASDPSLTINVNKMIGMINVKR